MRIIILSGALILASFGFIKAQESQDSKIYQLVIEKTLEQRLGKIKKSKVISIVDSTISISNQSWILDGFEYHLFTAPINESKLENSKYALQNLVSDTIPKQIDISSIILRLKKKELTKGELDTMFKISPSDGWNKFYQKNKRSVGFINLSSVNYYKGSAVVYVDYNYGGLGATGDVYILEYKSYEWVIKTQFNVYKS